ncbi:alpha/beta hydrolase [Parapedobacter indicus]|uniref:Acetyl esterase/lipase n=1 Tax=Parapedobacter indicus TaxID=1477437 RepID=A0A1I3GWV4_9SPHI|nr:alpha/beta hydrolase [Parapedobacter indicus]PPL02811.1 acetyl esterase/lipase [Parapedobacter indicus]SFI27879.1 Acetyl esterase/lipase [Parapedobacter indicus]
MVKYLVFILGCAVIYCNAQERFPLYEGAVPNSKPTADRERDEPNAAVDTLTFQVSVPSLTVFLPPPDKANGTAVIICPGGGYHVLLTKREGSDVAKAFNELGIAAFVLRYRLPDDEIMIDKSIGPLQDAQQAIRLVRKRAVVWGIDPDKIGIMGFSAGGHLAATVGTHFDKAYVANLENMSLRPDFMLLVNPVISMTDGIGHTGSRNYLLGVAPAIEQINVFSNELQVDSLTPPTFLVHSDADIVVPVENSFCFYEALHKHKVAAGLHIYSKGEHGFLTAPSFDEWFGRCIHWMQEQNFF